MSRFVHNVILRGAVQVTAVIGPQTLTHGGGRSLWQVYASTEEVRTFAASLTQSHPQLQVEILALESDPPLELDLSEEEPDARL